MASPDPDEDGVDASLARWRARVDAALASALDGLEGTEPRLHAAMGHAVLLGGKRMRPLLTCAAGTACGAREEVLDAPAAAVELVHAYSLVHDDLPAMDDDALRRGQPTVHVAFDDATAILAGDALQALAFTTLAAAPVDDAARVAMLAELAAAAGASGMCGGQAFDLAATGRKGGQVHFRRKGGQVHFPGEEIRRRPILDPETEPDPLFSPSRPGRRPAHHTCPRRRRRRPVRPASPRERRRRRVRRPGW